MIRDGGVSCDLPTSCTSDACWLSCAQGVGSLRTCMSLGGLWRTAGMAGAITGLCMRGDEMTGRDWHKRCKSFRKDDIIGDAKQIQLTNMRASAVELRAGGEELHCTGEHFGQLDLRGIADYRSLPIGFITLDNLRCWQDTLLHTITSCTGQI